MVKRSRRVKYFIIGGLLLFICWVSYWMLTAAKGQSNKLLKVGKTGFKNDIPGDKDLEEGSHEELKYHKKSTPVEVIRKSNRNKIPDDYYENNEVNYPTEKEKHSEKEIHSEKEKDSEKEKHFDVRETYKYTKLTTRKKSDVLDKQREFGKDVKQTKDESSIKELNKKKEEVKDDDDDLSWIEVERKTNAPNAVTFNYMNRNMDEYRKIYDKVSSIKLNESLSQSNKQIVVVERNGGLGVNIKSIATARPQPRPWKTGADVEFTDDSYALIHNGIISKVRKNLRGDKPTNLPGVSEENYVFSSNSLPKNKFLRPSVGNGIIGTVAQSNRVYMSGLYSGLLSESHRAVIPATCSFSITRVEPEQNFTMTYLHNIATGIYSETLYGTTCTITRRLYAHRTIGGVMVSEVEVTRKNPSEALKIFIDLKKWKPSSDLTFLAQESEMDEVSYKVGKSSAPEHLELNDTSIHILYDHIPPELSPPSGSKTTKWVFLSVYALNKSEVFRQYNKSVVLMHGRDDLYYSHIDSWLKLWNSGRIDLNGNTAASRAVYSAWYALLSSVPLKSNHLFTGLSPCGLPYGGEDGHCSDHVTWTQELILFPPLLMFHSTCARRVLESRLRLAHGATLNAQVLGVNGVVFPLESGVSGVELHRNGSSISSKSPHVSAGLILAFAQYIYATSTKISVSLANQRLLSDIAQFLVQKTILDGDHFSVKGVLPLDDSHGLVNDSPYVNTVISEALSALTSLVTSDSKSVKKWSKIADNIYLPYDKRLVIHPSYEGFQQIDILKEADAILLGYPLMSKKINSVSRRADLEFYEKKLQPDSSPWTKAMHLIGWLELNEPSMALQKLNSLAHLSDNPFYVWCNYALFEGLSDRGIMYNHLVSAGAFLQSIINGYGGLRLLPDRLDLNPFLPPQTDHIDLHGIQYLGYRLHVSISEDQVTVKAEPVSKVKQSQLQLCIYSTNEKHALSLELVKIIRTKFYITTIN